MSFGHHTPESLLPRSDSKNPATTCKGITQNGRPCRRGLVASPTTSPAPSPTRGHGVLAVLQGETDGHSNAAAFYCWQHKNQADRLAAADATKTKIYPLKGKTSMDTLVDRIGILDLEADSPKTNRYQRRKHKEHTVKKRDTMPVEWNDMQRPLMIVPEGFENSDHISKPRPRPQHGRSNLKASVMCCLRADDDDDNMPPPRTSRERQRPQPQAYQQPQSMSHGVDAGRPVRQATSSVIQVPSPVHRKPVVGQSSPAMLSPSSRIRPSTSQSQTQSLLSLIPSTLPPQTVAALMAEISRPLTDTDLKTSGYIYIFWLTPEADGDGPDSDLASTILDDASPGRGTIQDQLLERYSSHRRAPGTKPQLSPPTSRTVLLKIGRATNVHRRMSQWQKQCGHNITLLRYYPRVHDTNGTAPQPTSTTPLLPRVERLIHIELAGTRAKQERCGRCGRDHREWFEVDASRHGIRAVDECVRRWVRWGTRKGGGKEQKRVGSRSVGQESWAIESADVKPDSLAPGVGGLTIETFKDSYA